MKRKRNRNATFVSRWGSLVVVASRFERNESLCSLYPLVMHSSRVSCEVANARSRRGVAEYDAKERVFVTSSQTSFTTLNVSLRRPASRIRTPYSLVLHTIRLPPHALLPIRRNNPIFPFLTLRNDLST